MSLELVRYLPTVPSHKTLLNRLDDPVTHAPTGHLQALLDKFEIA